MGDCSTVVQRADDNWFGNFGYQSAMDSSDEEQPTQRHRVESAEMAPTDKNDNIQPGVPPETSDVRYQSLHAAESSDVCEESEESWNDSPPLSALVLETPMEFSATSRTDTHERILPLTPFSQKKNSQKFTISFNVTEPLPAAATASDDAMHSLQYDVNVIARQSQQTASTLASSTAWTSWFMVPLETELSKANQVADFPPDTGTFAAPASTFETTQTTIALTDAYSIGLLSADLKSPSFHEPQIQQVHGLHSDASSGSEPELVKPLSALHLSTNIPPGTELPGRTLNPVAGPSRTHPDCSTIFYRRKYNPGIDRPRSYKCNVPGQIVGLCLSL